MSPAFRSAYGRMVVLLALGLLALSVGATAYLLLAQGNGGPLGVGGVAGVEKSEHPQAQNRKAVTLLLIVSISVLLVFLFFLAAYLVIRIGQFVARERVGGKPTEYVDAWGNYRLTDAQISAATAEGRAEEGDEPPAPNPPPPPESPSGS